MDSPKKIPVVILNGFLGSGKTTLFRSLLAQSQKKNLSVCAIVNDMSELDIDGELIGNTAIVEEDHRMFETIPACVLSSDTGLAALDQALSRLLCHKTPDLVIIETSGSTHPMPLIHYFKDQTQTVLIGVLALVDSLMLAHDYHDGQTLIPNLQNNMALGARDTTNLLVEQILFCSHLLLTKTDRLPDEKSAQIASHIQSVNPYVPPICVHFGHLSIESLLTLPEYDYFKVAQLIDELTPILEADAQANTPYALATRVIKDDRPFHPQRLWEVCNQYLGDKIYRSKGFFWLASRDKQALLWNQVGGSISLEVTGSWRAGVVENAHHGITDMEIQHLKKQLATQSGRFGDRYCEVTVIGHKTQVELFTQALKSCFLTEEEIQKWLQGHEFKDPWPDKLVKLTL